MQDRYELSPVGRNAFNAKAESHTSNANAVQQPRSFHVSTRNEQPKRECESAPSVRSVRISLIDLIVCPDRLQEDCLGPLVLDELKNNPQIVAGATSP